MNKICDIILLSYESPELLEKCVESVLENVTVPSRLIVVDNASSDPEVKKYLQGLEGNGIVSVEKLFLEKNYGFAGGMNKGLALSNALYVFLLNNDCVFTKGALEEMIDIAAKKNEIGLVNPQSNTFGSKPPKGVTLDEHAAYVAKNKGKYAELGHAIGFACLIRRDVIEKIGHFDENYAGVCYEDSDYSAQAQEAGFIAVLAEGAYIYHHEQASRKNLRGRNKIYERNKGIFEEKWGRILRALYFDGELDIADDAEFIPRYGLLKGLARNRIFVDIYFEDTSGRKKADAEKCAERTIRHADISLKPLKGSAAHVVWKVFTKKKKYDAVFLRKGRLNGLLNFFKSFHGAKIFTLEGDKLLNAPDGRMYSLENAAELAGYLRNK